MDMMRITGISITAALTALILRRMKPEFGPALVLCCGAMLLLLTSPGIAQLIDGITAFAAKGGVSSGTTASLLKITGISLLTDFAARTCRDAGEAGIAAHTELAGRIMILTLTLPAMQRLMDLILSVSA